MGNPESPFLYSLIKIFLFCLLVITSNSLYSATVADKTSSTCHADFTHIRKPLIELIDAVRYEFEIPGISLVVTRGQENIWLEGFGLADEENNMPVTPLTVFRAGSLAKPLTAMAVLQLTEKDIVDIDQPVHAYLPEFKIKSRFDTTREPITLRSIMCHHSGLPTDLNKGKWSTENFIDVAANLSDEFTAYPPNMVFSYSNIGYTLLGHIIDKVQPLNYADYMQKNIFQPAGMKSTTVSAIVPQEPGYSKGYSNGESKTLLPIRDIPAYGLMTNSLDLGELMKTFFDRGYLYHSKILLPETLEEMMEPQNTDVPLDMDIINGLGWFIEHDNEDDNKLLIRHGGTTLYFSSEMIFSPEENLGVAVLANASGSRQIVAELAMEIFRRFREENNEKAYAPLNLEQIKREMGSHQDTKILGDYATDIGLISIQAEGDQICGCVANETFDLIPYPNGWLGMKPDSVDSLPPSYQSLGKMQYKSRLIDGEEVIIAKYNGKETVLGQKIPKQEIPEVWERRVGKYRVKNADDLFPINETELLINNGLLYMRYKMPLLSSQPIQSPLRPISDNEAIILGLGRTRGETIRAYQHDGQEWLHYSGYYGSKIKK